MASRSTQIHQKKNPLLSGTYEKNDKNTSKVLDSTAQCDKMGVYQERNRKEVSMTEYTIPNTIENRIKVRQAVAEYMVTKCLSKEEIMALAMDQLEETFALAKHTIGDLARMVNETPADAGCREPQPEQALYFGTYHNELPEDQYYFFTRERSPEYNSLEVKGAE